MSSKVGLRNEPSNVTRLLFQSTFTWFVACSLTLHPDLTGVSPEPASSSTSLAGTTHDLGLRTAYYTVTVPIWLDIITTASEWAASFLSPEAKEVLEVLGGVVVVFSVSASTSSSQNKELIKEVGRVVKEGLGGWEWDGVGLGVGIGEVSHLDDLDVWDELCGDAGLEFVHVGSTASQDDAKNEFGGEDLYLPTCFTSCCSQTLRENGDSSCPRGSRVERLGFTRNSR